MIVALPAIAAAFLMVFTTKEPERGATEDALKVGGALPFLRLALGCAERYPQEGHLSLDAKTKNVIAVSGGFQHQCLPLEICPFKQFEARKMACSFRHCAKCVISDNRHCFWVAPVTALMLLSHMGVCTCPPGLMDTFQSHASQCMLGCSELLQWCFNLKAFACAGSVRGGGIHL